MSFESQFKKLKVLGQGGYGKVLLVERLSDGKQFAAKTFGPDPDYNEINILASFEHPNLLHLEDIVLSSSGEMYIILPLADSELTKYIRTISTLISKYNKFERTVEVMYQIISAVALLNQFGYFHCDIKPQNVLMFGDKPVLADFSLTRGDSNKYVEDLACGTITYKDYQTLGVEYDLNHVKTKVDISRFKSEKANYFQTDVFSLGLLMFNMYYGFDLIDYDMGDREHIAQEYLDLESRIQKRIDDLELAQSQGKKLTLIGNPIVEDLKILKCVQQCTKFSNQDRIKNAAEILKCDLFVDKVMSQPIPGTMVANYLPTKNWCQELSTSGRPMSGIIKITINWCLEVFNTHPSKLFLLTYTVFETLLYRSLEFNLDTKKIQLYACAAMYLAMCVTTEIPIKLNKLAYVSGGAFTINELDAAISDFVVRVKGVIRIPTIYDVTMNAAEIIWWIHKVSQNCEVIEKTPQEMHVEYGIAEAANQDLFNLRIPKYAVVSMKKPTANQPIYKIQYYASEEDYKNGQLTQVSLKL